jgi:hypothetical protein
VRNILWWYVDRVGVPAHAKDVCRVDEGCECDMVGSVNSALLLLFPQASS